MHEALLLLRGVEADTLRLPAPAQVAARLAPEALPALAHAGGMAADLPDALVTCGIEEAARIVASLGGEVDAQASTVLAFTRHAVLPGRDAVRLYFGLRRLDRLGLADFHDYWLNRHADFGRRLIPPYTYHQLHADPGETTRLARPTGLSASTLDGVVEVHFPDVDALVRQLSREDVAQGALEDERHFIDHARSQFWAYRELAA
ncbi:MAG TPA: EthD domain-containing protein [Novosphingobium sp.]|nr:EthD domain-containing protein [Novosphingobium sp.]